MLAFYSMMVNPAGRRCLMVGGSQALFEQLARQDQAAVWECIGDLLRQTPGARVSVRKAHE